jgi:putative ABC transport system permease protein
MRRLAQLFRRRRLDQELAAEIAAHIEEKTEELVEAGMGREEACYAARARFGNGTAVLEQGRAVWSFTRVESFLRDLRIGARALRHAPLFTAAAVATLMLGIGANTAIFSLIDAVLLRPLPFPEPERIVAIWERPPKTVVTAALESRRQRNPVSPANFLDWRERSRSFQAMAAVSPPMPVGLSGFGQPIAVDGLSVSPDFFRILGVRPLLGRTFDDREAVPNGPPLVVLSYSLWRRQFGGDRTAVGRTLSIVDVPHTIVGVMPEGFDLPFEHAELWTPFAMSRSLAEDQGRYLDVLAKLKPGVSMARAQAELAGVARQIAVERPETNRGWSAGIVSLSEQTTGDVGTALWLLFGAVTFVLLIAAGNVASLLMMRGTERRREIALRVALGAGRGRIVSQLLTESLLLSLVGGLLGVGLAALGLRVITASLPALALPRLDGVDVSARVLAFSLGLALLTTLLFGLAPAVAFARTSPEAALRAGDRGATRRGGLRRILVVVEVALSLVLLAGAGLLARSFLNQIEVSRGFRTDHILTMQMFFAPARYYDDHRRGRYLDEIVSRVRTLPGVEAASSVNLLPMTGIVSGSGFWRLDRSEPEPGAQPTADFVIVSPQYFRVMGIPMLGGRDFDAHDTMSTEPAIVVNQEFAEKFFPGENPIGKRLHMNWNVQHGVIVGVCARARQTSLSVAPQPTLFLAQAQGPMYFGALVVRTRGAAPAALASAVEDAVHAVDPDQAISGVESMNEVVAQSVARPRMEAVLLGIFAALAVALAAIGLYGVLAYSVTQRTREIGIRMALGADVAQLVTGVVRDGLGLMVAGIAVGLAAALALTHLLASLLYDVRPADPLTFAAVSALLLAVGLCAAWAPARRAAAVDPAGSLRSE